MSELMELSNDINVITAEIKFLEKSMKKSMIEHSWEIGGRLVHVKENLGHGNFGTWIEDNFEFTWQYSNQFMKFFKQYPNYKHASNLPSWTHVVETLYLPENIDREEFLNKEHKINSTGEYKNPRDMTREELREVKKALKEKEEYLKQLEQDKNKLGQLLTEERNKPTKEVIVEKERVVDNTDYSKINQLQNELNTYKSNLSQIEKQKQLLEQRLKQEEKDVNEYNKVKEELKRLHSEKDDIHRQIESATALSGLYIEIEHFLQNKLAPVKYSRALTERRDSKVAMENLEGIIHMVQVWTDEMKSYLPSKKDMNNIIDAEVIEYE